MGNDERQPPARGFLLPTFLCRRFQAETVCNLEGLTAKNVSERAETLMKCECGDGPLSIWCSSSLPVGEVLSPF